MSQADVGMLKSIHEMLRVKDDKPAAPVHGNRAERRAAKARNRKLQKKNLRRSNMNRM